MKFWDLQYRKNTPNLGGIKMKKNLKSFGYKLKKNAILLSLLLGSVIIAGCKQPNGGDDYEDVVVTPDNPSNPTNPDPVNPDPNPGEPGVDPDPVPENNVYVKDIDINNFTPDSTKTYIFGADSNSVDVAKFIQVKKILEDNNISKISYDYNTSSVDFKLDFSNKSFADTTNEIENRNDFASTLDNGVFTTNDYDKTITINGVTFITHPVAKEGSDNRIQQAFQFDKDVKKVSVTFGDKYNMTEAYKGGIILNGGDNTELTLNNFENTTLTGDVYFESMGDFNVKTKKFKETTLISKLATGDTLPKTSNLFFGKVAETAETFYGTGIDKIFENYYNKGVADKISVGKASDIPFDAEEYLGGGYMYSINGSYNSNAYNLDINTALLMAEKLTNNLKNVNVSGNLTSDVETSIIPRNVRFSGDVSGLTFTKPGNYGIIDFAKVGPKWIAALNSKIIVNGVKNDGVEKGIFGYAVDFSNVDESLLNQVSVKATGVDTVYTKTGSFSGSYVTGVHFKSGSSASTNQAWEKKGRGETVSDNELISKLDVKAKANNPLLQKLLDENQHVYG